MQELGDRLKALSEMAAQDVSAELRPTNDALRRIRVGRAIRSGAALATVLVLAIGGYAGARAITNDEALPPVNPDSDIFVGTWFSTDIDGSSQTMTIETSGEDSYSIEMLDDAAGVCSGASSTMTGTGGLDGPRRLVIPEPDFLCDDGSAPESDTGEPIADLLRNFTFVLDRQTDTLTDNIGVTWGRERAPVTDCQAPDDPEAMPDPACMRGRQLSETEVVSGSYEGTPWQLSIYTEPVITENHAEGYHSLGLKGSFDGDTFTRHSGIRPDSELEGTTGTKLIAIKDSLNEALVISGTVTPEVTRVEFTEGDQTVSAETIAVPRSVGDDFRIFVLFAPFGTDVSCLEWDIPTVNCFGADQRIVAFDASGDVVARKILHPEIGWDCLVCSVDPDPDEFVTRGSEGGLEWRLSARRWDTDGCFSLSLGHEAAGGRGCLTRPAADWFGEAAQFVEPSRPEVAPVYGAIPSHVDEVHIELDDGSVTTAEIFRPERHKFAYYLAWIPDAFATGSVRFISGGNEAGTLPLCGADHSDRTVSFVCYGTPDEE